MTVNTRSETTNISDRSGGQAKLADAENISTGATAETANTASTTLYLHVEGAVDITVEASPDGGETWYVLPESPVQFTAAGDNAVQFGYDFNRIRVTGSNSTAVTAQLREVV